MSVISVGRLRLRLSFVSDLIISFRTRMTRYIYCLWDAEVTYEYRTKPYMEEASILDVEFATKTSKNTSKIYKENCLNHSNYSTTS